jgi:hypothetical protein
MIQSLLDLADHVSYGFDRDKDDVKVAERMVARSLFKYTSCGISFWVPDEKTVGVAGYCEGSDIEHETHYLEYPFSVEDFDAAVGRADKDGCETWDATHGCESCNPDGSCDEWGNEIAPGDFGGPVNADCPECKGHGAVL